VSPPNRKRKKKIAPRKKKGTPLPSLWKVLDKRDRKKKIPGKADPSLSGGKVLRSKHTSPHSTLPMASKADTGHDDANWIEKEKSGEETKQLKEKT